MVSLIYTHTVGLK